MAEFANPFSVLKLDRKLTDKELIRAIRLMIVAEYEATQLYEQLAESISNKKAIKLLLDIAKEELVHAGEFIKLLEELSPEEIKLYEEGKEEAEEII